jgi:hypothetical protein
MNHLPGGQELTQLAQAGMFTETAYGGVGFGLGFSVMQSPARAQILGTPGEYAWGGAASTAFLDRPGRGPHRHLHDAAHAVVVVPAAPQAARADVCRAARLTASGAPSGTGVGVTSRCVEWRAGRT